MRSYFLEDPLHPQGGISIGVRRDDDCIFCEHCTDLWWDYTNLVYMLLCDLDIERPFNMDPCISFKEDYYEQESNS